ncbi:MAG: hypothetical protein WA982_03780 [Rubrobacteraceae bacterium]
MGAKKTLQGDSRATANGSMKREGTKRITVDLPRDEHRFLRDTTYDLDADGIKVMRALLQELRDDPELFDRVRERIAGL